MSYPTTVFAALTAAAAITVASASAQAQPHEPGRFRAALAGDSVIVTLDNAVFDHTEDQSVAVVDQRGDTVTLIPTAIEMNQQRFVVRHAISDDARTLTLTPDLQAVRAAAVGPVASPMEEQLALTQLASDLGTYMGTGSAIGTLVGAVIGLGLGLSSCLITGPACLTITPAAVAAFASAGGIAGTLVGGGAALAGSGWNYILTVQSPPGQSPYAGQDEALNSDGTGVPEPALRLPSGSSDGFETGSSS
ncbi:hypothetical protein AB0H49_22580 [Nocardia sp. NPDC050713]|uniref:hypothetical protein n=1 Tax=Nocardia sp. NPDC050713 TaxID=3154511 RepID=UPI0033C1A1FB